MINPRRRHRRGPLDFTELRESSLIADLVQTHADGDVEEPDCIELALAPVLSHWSVAEGPRLLGVDEWGKVLALDIWCISRDYAWAMTPEGAVRLGEQSRLPLEWERR